jgi:hypothetical protein
VTSEHTGRLIHLLERVADSLEMANKLRALEIDLERARLNVTVMEHQRAVSAQAVDVEYKRALLEGQKKTSKIIERSVPPPEPWQQGGEDPS